MEHGQSTEGGLATNRQWKHSPNPSGWRKESPERAGWYRLAQRELGDHSRAEVRQIVDRAHKPLGLNPTQQRLLEELQRRTFDDDWTHGRRPIVWLSNPALAERLNVSVSSIRANLSVLADLGLITYRDSGNCRRQGGRDSETGQVKFAFGIDLSILHARYEELALLVEAHETQRNEWIQLKTIVTRLRRQIPAHIVAAQGLALCGRWNTWRRRYERVSAFVGRASNATAETLKRAAAILERVLADVQQAMLAQAIEDKSVATPCSDEQLLQTTNQTPFVKTNGTDKRNCANAQSLSFLNAGSAGKMALEKKPAASGEAESSQKAPWDGSINLGQVLKACPTAFEFMPAQPRSWNDFVGSVSTLRPMMGISPSAWHDAAAILGRERACVALAIIMEKEGKGQVRSAGGYLRGMTERARNGTLHLDRTIRALAAEKFRES